MYELTHKEAIEVTSLEAVEAVGAKNCDFTNRVMNNGMVEFSAHVEAADQDGGKTTLIAYYYQTEEAVNACETLDQLDWEIDHYQVC